MFSARIATFFPFKRMIGSSLSGPKGSSWLVPVQQPRVRLDLRVVQVPWKLPAQHGGGILRRLDPQLLIRLLGGGGIVRREDHVVQRPDGIIRMGRVLLTA